MKTILKLIAHGGDLYAPLRPNLAQLDPALFSMFSDDDKFLLVVEYPEGDHDTISYPDFNEENLRSALFDAREMGLIDDVPVVILPNGKEFTI